MTYNTPLPTGHDDFMNALAEDWHEYGEPDPYIASLVRAANEAAGRAAAKEARAPNESTPATLDDDECWPAARYQELVERVHALAAEPEVEELGV